MFRLYFSIFWNRSRDSQLAPHDTHGEATLTMKVPLIILAVGTLLVGFIPFSDFISADGKSFHSELNLLFSIGPIVLSLLSILSAYTLYFKQNNRPQKITASLGGFYKTAYKKFYIDEIYVLVTKKIIFNLIGKPAAWIDKNIVDGTMNGIA